MNASAREVTLKVNQANLVRHLKFSFTNRTTVLSELMQNARRAGATSVVFDFEPDRRILYSTDDGCGIDDIQVLLTVAESGWDVETVEREHPFGIGFLSAVHACEALAIESKFGRLSFRTADLLAFKSIPVDLSASRSWDGFTRIVLHGVSLTCHEQSALAEAEFHGTVERLAKGFPIPVVVNGREIPRPHAVEGPHQFIGTDFGMMSLSGYAEGESWMRDYTGDLAIYLQGLPVYSTPYRRFDHNINVVHLDSSRFFARLPDRDKLIDETEALSRIRQSILGIWQQRLKELKETTSPDVFAQGYRAIRDWRALELLNDVPYLPSAVLHRITDYPKCPTDWNDNTETLCETVSRLDIENGDIKLGHLNSPEDAADGFLRWMWAWKAGILFIDDAPTDLHPGHWVHPFVRNLDDDPFEIEILGHEKTQVYDGQWIGNIEARFCLAYRLSLAGETVECDRDAVYWERENAILMPAGESSGLVVRQISPFIDSDDRFCEADMEEEEDLMRLFVLSNRTDNAGETLKALLPKLRLEDYHVLRGKSLRVTIDRAGEFYVEPA